MKPFFSYYGSKYRLCQQGFYPKPFGKVCEPFAGSACYSLFYEPDEVVLLDADNRICDLWNYLINVSEFEILSIPDVITNDILVDLPYNQKLLVSRWINRGGVGVNVNKVGGWYLLHNGDGHCKVWNKFVKMRIVSQLHKIRDWTVIHGDYRQAPTADVYFIDPPYSGKGGKKYRYKISDWSAYKDWVLNLPKESFQIICENSDKKVDISSFGVAKWAQCRNANHIPNLEMSIVRGFCGNALF